MVDHEKSEDQRKNRVFERTRTQKMFAPMLSKT